MVANALAPSPLSIITPARINSISSVRGSDALPPEGFNDVGRNRASASGRRPCMLWLKARLARVRSDSGLPWRAMRLNSACSASSPRA